MCMTIMSVSRRGVQAKCHQRKERRCLWGLTGSESSVELKQVLALQLLRDQADLQPHAVQLGLRVHQHLLHIGDALGRRTGRRNVNREQEAGPLFHTLAVPRGGNLGFNISRRLQRAIRLPGTQTVPSFPQVCQLHNQTGFTEMWTCAISILR